MEYDILTPEECMWHSFTIITTLMVCTAYNYILDIISQNNKIITIIHVFIIKQYELFYNMHLALSTRKCIVIANS